MASQVQKQRTSAQRETEVAESETADSKEALKAELDDVIEDIDSVLEENAEEFVKGFVQKGGE